MALSKAERQTTFLKICDRDELFTLEELFVDVEKVQKIGEGAYGEVYKGLVSYNYERPDEEGKGDMEESSMTNVVFKLLPIEGENRVNQEDQKKYEQVMPEVVVTKELYNLSLDEGKAFYTRGFIQIYYAFLACGAYPKDLLEAWYKYEDECGTDNDAPVFNEKQEQLVVILNDGGEDAGHYHYDTGKDAYHVFMQVMHSLAVAEAALEFEHRDLHGNNVLVKPTKKNSILFKLDGKPYVVPTFGIKATIIDFTWSRISKNGETIALGMDADTELFMSQVHGKEYQFHVYRMIRENNRGDWTGFHPKSNILWMHYFLDKLIRKGVFRRKEGREHKFYMALFKATYSRLLRYSSCRDFVTSEFCQKALTAWEKVSESLERRERHEEEAKQKFLY